jgi:hypothetical protein
MKSRQGELSALVAKLLDENPQKVMRVETHNNAKFLEFTDELP